MKVAKPKPKRPAVEQKKTEKVKVEFKKRITQEFQDFAESKMRSFRTLMCVHDQDWGKLGYLYRVDIKVS